MNVYIGLLGCGTVGVGVFDLTNKRAEKIKDMTGLQPVIRRVLVRDLEKSRAANVDRSLLTISAADLLEDSEISVIVETIGGIEPARTLILQAIHAGKHVVTANKDLIALHGSEILEAAESCGVDVMYEAAVGGAIPLIRPLKECLTANEITDIKGIINGTTNYILSKMTETGVDFDEVLGEAQALGYAEADPTSDVDGLDAARKLTILASIAFNAKVRLDEVRVEGIRSVTAADVAYAHELGAVIKLLAVGSERDRKISLSVRPTLVPKQHPLAHVSDAFNALFVRGDAAGDLMFFGRGAGSMPTASAVVGDVIEVFKNITMNVSGRDGQLSIPHEISAVEPQLSRYYLRVSVADKPGVFAQIASIFGDADLSMETVLQKRVKNGDAEIVIVTHESSSAQVGRAVDALAQLSATRAVHAVYTFEADVNAG